MAGVKVKVPFEIHPDAYEMLMLIAEPLRAAGPFQGPSLSAGLRGDGRRLGRDLREDPLPAMRMSGRAPAEPGRKPNRR